jgi:hypothetical protein
MIPAHPLQLHLFDTNPDPAVIPPERRQRLMKLTGELLREAAQDEITWEEATKAMEAVDE